MCIDEARRHPLSGDIESLVCRNRGSAGVANKNDVPGTDPDIGGKGRAARPVMDQAAGEQPASNASPAITNNSLRIILSSAIMGAIMGAGGNNVTYSLQPSSACFPE